MEYTDILVIGGGAAGMAAALAASEAGRRVLLCEKEDRPGGILNRCTHRGFGRAFLGRDLTGQEYAGFFAERLYKSAAEVRTGVTVLSLSQDRTALLSGRKGLFRIKFRFCILAAGCLEKTPGSLGIPGTRPAGVLTAGTAQLLENTDGLIAGYRPVILGSGDVGLIMARQFAESGREVVALIEQKDQVGGLLRNRRECLEPYRIPVLLHTAAVEILGRDRITGVRIRDLETGFTRILHCDTLITAAGLIPDRTLCRDLMPAGRLPDWLRLCGNCESIHDIVDSVTREAMALGASLGQEAPRK